MKRVGEELKAISVANTPARAVFTACNRDLMMRQLKIDVLSVLVVTNKL